MHWNIVSQMLIIRTYLEKYEKLLNTFFYQVYRGGPGGER